MRRQTLKRYGIASVALMLPLALACEDPGQDVQNEAQQETDRIEQQLNEDEQAGAMPQQSDRQAEETSQRTDRRTAETAPTITVEESSELGGSFLATQEGQPLYMFTADAEGSSACYDRCARAWPPVLTSSGQSPEVQGSQAQSDMFGTIERRDGSTQVTYNGHPLYTFTQDEGSQQPTGQDQQSFGGEWYLMTPSGEHLEATGSQGGSSEAGDTTSGGAA